MTVGSRNMKKQASLSASDALSTAACLEWAAEDNERAAKAIGLDKGDDHAESLWHTATAWRMIARRLRDQVLSKD